MSGRICAALLATCGLIEVAGCHRAAGNGGVDGGEMTPVSGSAGHSGAAPSGGTQHSHDTPAVTPVMTVLGISLDDSVGPVSLRTKVYNQGPGVASIGGGCNYQCPVVIALKSGFLNTQSGQTVKAGDTVTLNGGGGVIPKCANTLPLPLQCTFTVKPALQPASGGTTLHYSQTVPLPPSFHPF